MIKTRILSVILMVAMLLSLTVYAEGTTDKVEDFALAPIFTDHMVLQQKETVKIYGSAPEGAEVMVALAGNRAVTTAENGRWLVELPPMQAGGPYRMSVWSESLRIDRFDIMVGEVWLVSGQSNAARTIEKTDHFNEIIKETKDYNPNIRIFNKYKNHTTQPDDTMGQRGACWMTMRSEDIEGCYIPCVAYYFAKYLSEELSVPVGIINTAYAGTPIEEWMNPETFKDGKYDYEEEAQKEIVNMGEGRVPGGNYNAMIYPFKDFVLRGFVWYQGENNVLDKDSENYKSYLEDMIYDWREAWGNQELPFIMVQIPGCDDYIKMPGHAFRVKEANLIVDKSVKNTALVTIDDLDGTDDIHPTNKKPVGERIANAAAVRVYGKEGVASGPMYNGCEIKDGAVYVDFEEGDGLFINSSDPASFKIAGEDGVEINANAEVADGRLKIWSDEVENPVYASYGTGDAQLPGLFNGAGYPASPFRTNMPETLVSDTMHTKSLEIEYKPDLDKPKFTDIEDIPEEYAVIALAQKDIVEEGSFNPYSDITGKDFAEWINNGAGKNIISGTDAEAGGEFVADGIEKLYEAVMHTEVNAQAVAIADIVRGKTSVTRAEAAVLVRKILVLAERDFQDALYERTKPAEGECVRLNPTDDTYISSLPMDAEKDGTFGSSKDISTRSIGHIKRRILTKFDIKETDTKDIKRAVLRMYLSATGNTTGYEESIAVYAIEGLEWSEEDMSFAKLDYFCGKELDIIYGVNQKGRYYEWDVTDYINNNDMDEVTLSVESVGFSQANSIFKAKENGVNIPELVIYK